MNDNENFLPEEACPYDPFSNEPNVPSWIIPISIVIPIFVIVLIILVFVFYKVKARRRKRTLAVMAKKIASVESCDSYRWVIPIVASGIMARDRYIIGLDLGPRAGA